MHCGDVADTLTNQACSCCCSVRTNAQRLPLCNAKTGVCPLLLREPTFETLPSTIPLTSQYSQDSRADDVDPHSFDGNTDTEQVYHLWCLPVVNGAHPGTVVTVFFLDKVPKISCMSATRFIDSTIRRSVRGRALIKNCRVFTSRWRTRVNRTWGGRINSRERRRLYPVGSVPLIRGFGKDIPELKLCRCWWRLIRPIRIWYHRCWVMTIQVIKIYPGQFGCIRNSRSEYTWR